MGSRRFRLADGHVDFGAQSSCAVGKLARFHAREQIEVFFHRSTAIGALLARLSERPALLAHLFGRQIAHVGLAGFDQLHGPFVELAEIVGGVEQPAFPIAAQPLDVFDDGVDVLGFFLGRIGVVEPQIAFATELLGESEIDGDRFRMADVQVAVRLRWKARMHATPVFVGLQIIQNDVSDEIGRGRLRGCRAGISLARWWIHGLFHCELWRAAGRATRAFRWLGECASNTFRGPRLPGFQIAAERSFGRTQRREWAGTFVRL